jgi:hypothetical protein
MAPSTLTCPWGDTSITLELPDDQRFYLIT